MRDAPFFSQNKSIVGEAKVYDFGRSADDVVCTCRLQFIFVSVSEQDAQGGNSCFLGAEDIMLSVAHHQHAGGGLDSQTCERLADHGDLVGPVHCCARDDLEIFCKIKAKEDLLCERFRLGGCNTKHGK